MEGKNNRDEFEEKSPSGSRGSLVPWVFLESYWVVLEDGCKTEPQRWVLGTLDERD